MSQCAYQPVPSLQQMLIERLRRLPREREMLCRGIRCIISLIVRAWLKVYHRFSIVGLENLPADGSFVLVANHASHLDTLCLQAAQVFIGHDAHDFVPLKVVRTLPRPPSCLQKTIGVGQQFVYFARHRSGVSALHQVLIGKHHGRTGRIVCNDRNRRGEHFENAESEAFDMRRKNTHAAIA